MQVVTLGINKVMKLLNPLNFHNRKNDVLNIFNGLRITINNVKRIRNTYAHGFANWVGGIESIYLLATSTDCRPYPGRIAYISPKKRCAHLYLRNIFN